MNELDRLEEDAKQAMKTPGFGMYANPAVVLDLIARLRAAESRANTTEQKSATLVCDDCGRATGVRFNGRCGDCLGRTA